MKQDELTTNFLVFVIGTKGEKWKGTRKEFSSLAEEYRSVYANFNVEEVMSFLDMMNPIVGVYLNNTYN